MTSLILGFFSALLLVLMSNAEFFRSARQTQPDTKKPLTDLCTFDQADAPNTSVQGQTANANASNASAPSKRRNKVIRKRAGSAGVCNFWNFANTSWVLSNASNAFFVGGPPQDVSKDSSMHGYLLLDLHSKSTQTSKSRRVISKIRQPTGPEGVCLTFWYTTSGLGAGGMQIILITQPISNLTNSSERTIWKNFDVTNAIWKRNSISFTSTQPYKIAMEGLITDLNFNAEDYFGYIAIDDTQLFSGFCQGDCNFDLNTCDWTNDQTDDFDWKLGWGTFNSNTGPLKDHSDYGGYLYIDSNYPRRTNDVARILSPVFTTSQPFCMRFWISEFGTGVGPLAVLIAPSGSNATVVWAIKEPLGAGLGRDVWYPAQVTVSWPDKFQVVIEAIVGLTSRGNVAIDDISFQQGACAPLPTFGSGRPGECAFLDDRCKWTVQRIQQPMNSPNLWKLVNSGSQVAQPKGHTLLPDNVIDGYMKFETNSFAHHALDRSRILSPILSPTDGNLCMNFWVYMSSPITSRNGLGALQVLLLNSTDASSIPTLIWRLENHQIPHWIHCQVSISSEIPFQIVFEGIRGAQVLGLIAVDDIAFVYPSKQSRKRRRFGRQAPPPEGPGSEPSPPVPPAGGDVGAAPPPPEGPPGEMPPVGEQNQTVTSSLKDSCQILPERAKVFPGDCSFDVDFCGWTTSGISSDIKWQMAVPTKSPANVHDRTYNIPQAGFIFFDPFTPAGNPTTSHIESAVLTPSDNLCVTFWYMIYGNDMTASLSVSERKLRTEPWREIWKENVVTRAPKWRFAEMHVGNNQTEVFKVVLSATSRASTIVVDDIKFFNDRCRKKP